jgi:hypothetical protein
MSIGIIYCETLKTEILSLVDDQPEISHLAEMPWRLHIDPDQLLNEVNLKIEQLQDKVDVIVLGYGRCQVMDRIGANCKVPVLRPSAEDCIGILLGQERYEEELENIPGTWFLSPGWTKMGTDFVFHELQLDRVKHKKIEPLQFARRLLEGFTRALYIDMHTGDEEIMLQAKALKIANDLNLQLEKTYGSYSLLEQIIHQACEIVQQKKIKSFLTVADGVSLNV